jgi:DNA mismatch repair ATPase MutS
LNPVSATTTSRGREADASAGDCRYICTKTKALACFATHFHELTGLAAQESNVKNLQVKALVSSTGSGAQDKQITFLYTVEPGTSPHPHSPFTARDADHAV